MPRVIAIYEPNDTLSRIIYFVHILSAIAAFGPLFLYPRLQRAGETQAVAALHMKLVFPSLILLWIAGMGLAGTQGLSVGGTWWISISILLWIGAVAVSWFLIRPAVANTGDDARSKMAAGIGITHLILVVTLALMIFKPGGYAFT